jgi:hypothetical protein
MERFDTEKEEADDDIFAYKRELVRRSELLLHMANCQALIGLSLSLMKLKDCQTDQWPLYYAEQILESIT